MFNCLYEYRNGLNWTFYYLIGVIVYIKYESCSTIWCNGGTCHLSTCFISNLVLWVMSWSIIDQQLQPKLISLRFSSNVTRYWKNIWSDLKFTILTALPLSLRRCLILMMMLTKFYKCWWLELALMMSIEVNESWRFSIGVNVAVY